MCGRVGLDVHSLLRLQVQWGVKHLLGDGTYLTQLSSHNDCRVLETGHSNDFWNSLSEKLAQWFLCLLLFCTFKLQNVFKAALDYFTKTRYKMKV